MERTTDFEANVETSVLRWLIRPTDWQTRYATMKHEFTNADEAHKAKIDAEANLKWRNVNGLNEMRQTWDEFARRKRNDFLGSRTGIKTEWSQENEADQTKQNRDETDNERLNWSELRKAPNTFEKIGNTEANFGDQTRKTIELKRNDSKFWDLKSLRGRWLKNWEKDRIGTKNGCER